MIDGVPQSNPLRNGGRSGKTIDPAMIGRIEMIHGANAMHGLGAQGGIINYIIKKSTGDNEHQVNFNVTVPNNLHADGISFGTSYAFSGVSKQLDAIGSVSYRNNGVYYDANDQMVGVSNTQGESMDSQSADVFIKLGHDFDESRLELMVNNFNMQNNGDYMAVDGDKPNGIPTGAIKQEQPWEAANNQVTTTSLTYTHQDIAGQKMQLQFFNQNFAAVYGAPCGIKYYDPSLEGSDQVTVCETTSDGKSLYYEQSRNKSIKWGMKASLMASNIADSGINLGYGMDVLRDTTQQDMLVIGAAWVPQSTYDNIAPYAQFDFDPIDNLTLSGGIRYEYGVLTVDDYKTLHGYGNKQIEGGSPDFNEILFNIGVSYKITPSTRIYTSFSQGFSMPDVGRVLRDGGSFSDINPSVENTLALAPVVTDNIEFGADHQGEHFSAKIVYYRSATDYGTLMEENVDASGSFVLKREKSLIEGIEANITAYLGDKDDLGLNLVIQEGRYDSNGDMSVDTDLGGANISPNRINLFWTHDFDNEISTRIQANFFMDKDFKDANDEIKSSFDGYTTVDASIAIPVYSGTLSIGLQNLLNEDYFTYYSQTEYRKDRYFKGMGRTATLGFSMPFQNKRLSCYITKNAAF